MVQKRAYEDIHTFRYSRKSFSIRRDIVSRGTLVTVCSHTLSLLIEKCSQDYLGVGYEKYFPGYLGVDYVYGKYFPEGLGAGYEKCFHLAASLQ